MSTLRPHPPTTRPFTDVDTVEIGEWTFDVALDGPAGGAPVLLLHGFPESFDAWRTVARALAVADLRVIAPDQRGYSPGARPEDVDAYRLGELVSDALAILDAQGARSAHIVGHDWGAAVAWALAARHPDRVRSLTAVSVPHLAAFGEALENDADQQERSEYITAFREPGRAESALLAESGARFRELFGGHVPDEVVDAHWKRLGSRGGLTAALNWYRAMSADMSELPAVAVPTTYVWSNGDEYLGRAGAEACGEHVTGDYRYVELDGVSHWVPGQAPGRLAHEILRRVAR